MTAHPFSLIAKPASARCNLRCSYCFYLGKAAQFGPGASLRMSDETLAAFVRQMGLAQPEGPVLFAWQGGEPTLLGVAWFRRAVQLQRQLLPGREVLNALQTNGVLLDAEWGAFLAGERFLVGISLDGPADLHDAQRVDAHGGRSWAAVMRGLAVLQRHQVEHNTLSCVGALAEGRGAEVYRFLRRQGVRHMQFIPLVEPGQAWSVSGPGWGRYLVDVFDLWARHDVGRVHVQWFEDALGRALGATGGVCVHSEICGDALALEHDGSVYACDHYVEPAWRLGNLAEQPLAELVTSPRQRAFGLAKRDGLAPECLACPWRRACNGGCPKHRDAEGHNHLCEGYRLYFGHIAPYIGAMARRMARGEPAAAAMPEFKTWPKAPRPEA